MARKVPSAWVTLLIDRQRFHHSHSHHKAESEKQRMGCSCRLQQRYLIALHRCGRRAMAVWGPHQRFDSTGRNSGLILSPSGIDCSPGHRRLGDAKTMLLGRTPRVRFRREKSRSSKTIAVDKGTGADSRCREKTSEFSAAAADEPTEVMRKLNSWASVRRLHDCAYSRESIGDWFMHALAYRVYGDGEANFSCMGNRQLPSGQNSELIPGRTSPCKHPLKWLQD